MSSNGVVTTVLPNGRRQLGRYAALELASAFIAFAMSLVVPLGPLLVVLWWKAPLAALAVISVWGASGLITLVASWSGPLAARICGFRDCRPAEYARLAPLLDDVTRRIGLDSRRAFVLRVWPCPPRTNDDDPPFLNACAAGTNLIAVTEDCLSVLSDDEIRALLAHEIGHHVGFEPAVRMLTCYYVWVFDVLFGRLGPLGRGVRAVLAAPVLATIAITTKPCELHADELAARMGFSRPLKRFLMMSGTKDPRTIRDAIVGSHPSLADRLHRIDAVMRHG
jgi:Zn-dependent protease with chaperone function